MWHVFTKETNKTYGLDPGHYITLPSLSWEAMLKYMDASIELISDPTLHQCIEKSIRGGLSMITNDPTKPSIYIFYLDKNNFYGHSMSQPLPKGGLRFATPEEILNINTDNFSKEIHDYHNDFPTFLVLQSI